MASKNNLFLAVAAGRLASDPTPLQNARKILKSQGAGVSKGWVGVIGPSLGGSAGSPFVPWMRSGPSVMALVSLLIS